MSPVVPTSEHFHLMGINDGKWYSINVNVSTITIIIIFSLLLIICGNHQSLYQTINNTTTGWPTKKTLKLSKWQTQYYINTVNILYDKYWFMPNCGNSDDIKKNCTYSSYNVNNCINFRFWFSNCIPGSAPKVLETELLFFWILKLVMKH